MTRSRSLRQDIASCPTCDLVVAIREGIEPGPRFTIYEVTKKDHDLVCPRRKRRLAPLRHRTELAPLGEPEQLPLDVAA